MMKDPAGEGLYDRRGEERFSMEEVRALKQVARMGLVARMLFAIAVGVVTLVGGVWAIIDRLASR